MANTQHGKILDIIALIIFLIISGLIAKGIYSRQQHLRELKKESSLLDHKIMIVKRNIKKIKRQIEMVKNDPDYYVKHEAADRFLAVSKDETIMIFNDNLSSNK